MRTLMCCDNCDDSECSGPTDAMGAAALTVLERLGVHERELLCLVGGGELSGGHHPLDVVRKVLELPSFVEAIRDLGYRTPREVKKLVSAARKQGTFAGVGL